MKRTTASHYKQPIAWFSFENLVFLTILINSLLIVLLILLT